jgi:hypothetical protein
MGPSSLEVLRGIIFYVSRVKVNNLFPCDFVLFLKRVRQITTISFVMSALMEIRQSHNVRILMKIDIRVHFQKMSRFLLWLLGTQVAKKKHLYF